MCPYDSKRLLPKSYVKHFPSESELRCEKFGSGSSNDSISSSDELNNDLLLNEYSLCPKFSECEDLD